MFDTLLAFVLIKETFRLNNLPDDQKRLLIFFVIKEEYVRHKKAGPAKQLTSVIRSQSSQQNLKQQKTQAKRGFRIPLEEGNLEYPNKMAHGSHDDIFFPQLLKWKIAVAEFHTRKSTNQRDRDKLVDILKHKSKMANKKGTPHKTNMDTQNDVWEFVIPWKKWPFLVSMLDLWAVAFGLFL